MRTCSFPNRGVRNGSGYVLLSPEPRSLAARIRSERDCRSGRRAYQECEDRMIKSQRFVTSHRFVLSLSRMTQRCLRPCRCASCFEFQEVADSIGHHRGRWESHWAWRENLFNASAAFTPGSRSLRVQRSPSVSSRRVLPVRRETQLLPRRPLWPGPRHAARRTFEQLSFQMARAPRCGPIVRGRRRMRWRLRRQDLDQ